MVKVVEMCPECDLPLDDCVCEGDGCIECNTQECLEDHPLYPCDAICFDCLIDYWEGVIEDGVRGLRELAKRGKKPNERCIAESG